MRNLIFLFCKHVKWAVYKIPINKELKGFNLSGQLSLPMHPPQFYQRGLILPIVNLQVDAVSPFHDCSDRAVNNEARVQGD